MRGERSRGRWDKEEADGVGREEKRRGERIILTKHNSKRKARRKGPKAAEGGESHLERAQGRQAGLCTSGGDTHHRLLSDLTGA